MTSDKDPSLNATAAQPDISVVLPALNEAGNVAPVVSALRELFAALALHSEIIVVDGGSVDRTHQEAEDFGAFCILQDRPGYGGALLSGFAQARGDFILTLDCDQSHPPHVFKELWANRHAADVLIASRFIEGGGSKAPLSRRLLSILLNWTFTSFLRLPIKDLSSGYRLYRRGVLKPAEYRPEDFNVLQEIAVRAHCDGYAMREVPLCFQPRRAGKSHASVLKFAFSYLRSIYRLWLLRQSPSSADYEHNAFDSRHLLQRWWQRKRLALLCELFDPNARTADLGCGSSRLTERHSHIIALDLNIAKLRFLKNSNPLRVQGTVSALPFASESLAQLVASQVLPYMTETDSVFQEFNRVLKPGGSLLITIPDSSTISWKIIGGLYRLLPNIARQTVKTRYTAGDLLARMHRHGFHAKQMRYIMGAELVAKFQKAPPHDKI